MSQLKKLYQRLSSRPTPSDVLFNEVDRLLVAYGFVRTQPSGGSSHYNYRHPKLEENFCLTISKHNGKVKMGYVKAAIKAIDRVKEIYEGVDKYEDE